MCGIYGQVQAEVYIDIHQILPARLSNTAALIKPCSAQIVRVIVQASILGHFHQPISRIPSPAFLDLPLNLHQAPFDDELAKPVVSGQTITRWRSLVSPFPLRYAEASLLFGQNPTITLSLSRHKCICTFAFTSLVNAIEFILRTTSPLWSESGDREHE